MLDVARNADGRLEVFGVNAQGHIWHTWQTAPNNGWVGGWAELYTDNDSLTTLRVVANADGRLEVFGVNAQGHIWHTWQTAPNNGWVGSWAELYTDNDSPHDRCGVARNADGRLEVFGINAQGHIWHTWQTAPNNGWVGSWAELYTDSRQPGHAGRRQHNADGRLEVFGVNAQGHIWHTWQTAPNNGNWIGELALPAPGRAVPGGKRVVLVGDDGQHHPLLRLRGHLDPVFAGEPGVRPDDLLPEREQRRLQPAVVPGSGAHHHRTPRLDSQRQTVVPDRS